MDHASSDIDAWGDWGKDEVKKNKTGKKAAGAADSSAAALPKADDPKAKNEPQPHIAPSKNESASRGAQQPTAREGDS